MGAMPATSGMHGRLLKPFAGALAIAVFHHGVGE